MLPPSHSRKSEKSLLIIYIIFVNLVLFISPILSIYMYWLQLYELGSYITSLRINYAISISCFGLIQLYLKINTDVLEKISNSNSDSPSIFWPGKYDELIKFNDRWLWMYHFGFYASWIFVILSIHNGEEAIRFIFGLTFIVIITLLIYALTARKRPTSAPNPTKVFDILPRLVRDILDYEKEHFSLANAFPSNRTALSVYLSSWLFVNLGYLAFIYPLLIAASCLFTKNNTVVDTGAGFILGVIISFLT